MIRTSLFTILRFFLAATVSSIASVAYADTFVRDDLIVDPIPSKFNICHGGTCENITDVSLNEQQWQQIRNIFKDKISPQQERQQIKIAIAKLEKIVGRLTNTYNDKAENITDDESQHYMDCIDESTNTTFYLMMIQNDALLRWHIYQDRSNRGFFFNGWPHTTAVIKEIRTEKLYAVDSWFLDNGQQPFIIPLDIWFDGWRASKK